MGAEPESDRCRVEGVTQYLREMHAGDAEAEQGIVELVYAELKQVAAQLVLSKAPAANFEPTALVHGFYERILDRTSLQVTDRRHFFTLAAKAMQQLLVDEYRRRTAKKRGGDAAEVTFDERIIERTGLRTDLLDVDAVLQELEAVDPRAASAARLRLFAGLSMAEIADVLEVSVPTAEREWRHARAWLGSRLSD